MTTGRRLGLALLGVAILVAGTTALHRLTGNDGERLRQAHIDASPTQVPGPDSGFSGLVKLTGEAAAVASLPVPPDMPLLEIKAELLARLAQGDASAGCRLYRELRRCWTFAISSETIDSVMNDIAAHELDDARAQTAVEFISELEQTRQDSRKVCEGVGAEQFESYFHIVLRTAELGHPLAMVEFAQDGGFLSSEFARHPERLLLWHQRAAEMIEQALRMGTPEAALALHYARAFDVGLLGALLPNDPVEAQAMSLLLSRVLTANWNPSPVLLTAEQARAAKQRADWLYMQYFAHREPEPELRLMRAMEPRIEHCEARS